MASTKQAAPQGAATSSNEPPPAVTASGADTPEAAATLDDDGEGSDAFNPAINPSVGGIEDLAPSPPQMAEVTDTTAVRGVREHEVDGKVYRFTPGRPTTMPLSAARRLVSIPSFIVRGMRGEIYEPARTEVVAGSSGLALRNDQVIATLDELMMPALRERAARWSDHALYDARAPRDEVILFIMDRLAEAPPPPKEARTGMRSAAEELFAADGSPRGDGFAGPVTATALAAALERERASRAEMAGRGVRGYVG